MTEVHRAREEKMNAFIKKVNQILTPNEGHQRTRETPQLLGKIKIFTRDEIYDHRINEVQAIFPSGGIITTILTDNRRNVKNKGLTTRKLITSLIIASHINNCIKIQNSVIKFLKRVPLKITANICHITKLFVTSVVDQITWQVIVIPILIFANEAQNSREKKLNKRHQIPGQLQNTSTSSSAFLVTKTKIYIEIIDMRQKQQNLTDNEHLKHLLKAKKLALQDAMKGLEEQGQIENCCKEVCATMSEELANVCSVFGETTWKLQSHSNNWTEYSKICECQSIVEIV